MKVVHVTDCFLPRVGGIELHVHDLATRQALGGVDVTVATRTAGPDVDSPLTVHRGPVPQPWLLAERPDVVHAHVSVVSPYALGAARRAARLGIPTVVTVHSLWEGAHPAGVLVRDLWRMSDWPVRWSAVSERAALPVHELLRVPVHVLPNAVDVASWRATGGAEGRESGVVQVVSVMRLTKVKRTMPLLRILHEVSRRTPLQAVVVGDGPERAAAARYVRRHRLEEAIRLVGPLDRGSIRALLAESDVFVAPAHRESFGIAALEARSAGLPVVASVRSGVPTFIQHERDGLLADLDEEFVYSLIRLLTDESLRRSLRLHNRSVPPSCDWDTALRLNAGLYELALAGRRTGAGR